MRVSCAASKDRAQAYCVTIARRCKMRYTVERLRNNYDTN